MVGILYASTPNPKQIEHWRRAITQHLPRAELRVWPDFGDPATISAVLAWRFQHGSLRQFPNLKVICSLGAGVDHIFADPDLPPGVPITRLVDPDLAQGISEYVAMAVLRYHRQLPDYEAQQRAGRWQNLGRPETTERRIGLLGYGLLGQATAQRLQPFGFPLAAWARSPRPADIELFLGEAQLAPFLARTDMLVCLLPLTPATHGIINAHTLGLLPRGAAIVNVARGKHIVDADLIEALDSGHIVGATLDVFATEPLPGDHPFWKHPKVTITPHIAALTNPATAAQQICDNIKRSLAGAPLLNVVDPAVGY
jgi:glyoxylate/hydroxypyruvate reductase